MWDERVIYAEPPRIVIRSATPFFTRGLSPFLCLAASWNVCWDGAACIGYHGRRIR